MASVWEECETEFALKLWNDKISCANIAKQMVAEFGRKFTKNSVIGQANRKGFPSRKKPTPKKVKLVKRVVVWSRDELAELSAMWPIMDVQDIQFKLNSRYKGGRTLSALRYKATMLGLKKEKKVDKPKKEAIIINPVHLNDIKDGMCRYIIGEPKDLMCCGKNTKGTYCEHHHNICYRG